MGTGSKRMFSLRPYLKKKNGNPSPIITLRGNLEMNM
jgi:hypothetical protein